MALILFSLSFYDDDRKQNYYILFIFKSIFFLFFIVAILLLFIQFQQTQTFIIRTNTFARLTNMKKKKKIMTI